MVYGATLVNSNKIIGDSSPQKYRPRTRSDFIAVIRRLFFKISACSVRAVISGATDCADFKMEYRLKTKIFTGGLVNPWYILLSELTLNCNEAQSDGGESATVSLRRQWRLEKT